MPRFSLVESLGLRGVCGVVALCWGATACTSGAGNGAGATWGYSLPETGGPIDVTGQTKDAGSKGLPDGATPVEDEVDDATSAPDDHAKPDLKAIDASKEDLDNDGFSPAQGDCDDADPAVHPGAFDVCDGKDNDCDGKADWSDKDGDGYSPNPCNGQQADCDDSNAKIHPSAKTNCQNDKDNDCDGKLDSDQDVDGDGYPSCIDCNDLVSSIHPEAAQNCENNKDNNCDGIVDSLVDGDKDGTPGCQDCNDQDPDMHPGLLETCDGKDNDCNGVVDDQDNDGDGYLGCGQDCDDTDINIHPDAPRNCKNGKDNDCDGKLDANQDGDGDGYPGCQDCDDNNKSVNPGAIEFPNDVLDNNCNGKTDEVTPPCDKPGLGSSVGSDYPVAMDICLGVASSALAVDAGAKAHAIKQKYGPQNLPVMGPNMVVLSSGAAAASGDAGYVVPQPGTSFSNSAPYPGGACPNSGAVYDYTEWKLALKVPTNAHAFSFEFNFMSAEYPEYVGTQFNDKFFAILDSKSFKGNISFDSKGNCISINNALFNVCSGCALGAASLSGTGYDGGIGGGTGWLTTTAPVTPGETITLRFMIFDEGDHIYDSAVLLDHFRWQATALKGGPSTVRPGGS
jgi:hypothetical protein